MSSAAHALKEAGNAAFRQAKYDEAVALYTEAMQKDPSESTYPLNRCMAHLKLQKYAEADRDATKSLALLPAGNPKALYRRGLARRALGRIEQARADLKAALQEEPGNAAVRAELDSLMAASQPPEPEPPVVADTQTTKKATRNDAAVSASQASAQAALPSKRDPSSTQNGTQPKPKPQKGPEPPTPAPATLEAQQRRSAALKAAITPQTGRNTDADQGEGTSLLLEVSTRRLDKESIPTAAAAADSAAAAAAPSSKKDFRSLRQARDERYRPPRAASPALSEQAGVGAGAGADVAESTAEQPKPNPIPDPQPDRAAADTGIESAAPELRLPTVPPPRTLYEFEKRWNDRADNSARLALLQSIKAHHVDLPELAQQNLSPELVDGVIRCLAQNLPSSRNLQSTAVFLLDGFSRCARFDFVSMLCGETGSLPLLLDKADPVQKEILQRWGL